jgi:predicted unusual protein kinase regulating ubiquinone biosynthesis (AarF/ABC1/UbiB family)
MTDQNLSELLAALSSTEERETAAPDARLQEILADLARRPVPVHSLHRLWTLGELSAQVALAYGALWMRGWFADAETRKRRAMETNLRMALRMVHRLGYLRGAMTKLGQMAGHFPQIVPREIADTLESLHFDAPPMHYALIREVIANQLGKEPEELFASFDRDAFAAASLGQVHRARLHSGEPVAVKIQYPGIARTIDADFRNLSALLFPMRLSADWEYVKAQFEEIRRMLNQEVDYRQEAESMRRASALFQPEDGVVIPRIYDEYSSARVLTAGLLTGSHLHDFLATDPPQALRNRFGTAIYRSHFRMYYADMNYADPHAGNFLFLDDGRLGLLDFGCVQYYGEEERELGTLSERWITGDESAIPRVLELACGVRPGDPGFAAYQSMIRRSFDWMMEPMRTIGAFDFGDEGHLNRGFAFLSGMVRGRTMRAHPTYVYFERTVFGVKALLYRLRAQVDVRNLHAQELAIARSRTEPRY